MVLHNYCAIYSRKQNPALRSSFENTSRNIFIQKKQSKVTPTFADSSLCRGTTGISSYTSSISNSQSNVQASNTLLHEYYYQVSYFLMCIVSVVNFNGFILNPQKPFTLMTVARLNGIIPKFASSLNSRIEILLSLF